MGYTLEYGHGRARKPFPWAGLSIVLFAFAFLMGVAYTVVFNAIRDNPGIYPRIEKLYSDMPTGFWGTILLFMLPGAGALAIGLLRGAWKHSRLTVIVSLVTALLACPISSVFVGLWVSVGVFHYELFPHD